MRSTRVTSSAAFLGEKGKSDVMSNDDLRGYENRRGDPSPSERMAALEVGGEER